MYPLPSEFKAWLAAHLSKSLILTPLALQNTSQPTFDDRYSLAFREAELHLLLDILPRQLAQNSVNAVITRLLNPFDFCSSRCER